MQFEIRTKFDIGLYVYYKIHCITMHNYNSCNSVKTLYKTEIKHSSVRGIFQVFWPSGSHCPAERINMAIRVRSKCVLITRHVINDTIKEIPQQILRNINEKLDSKYRCQCIVQR